MSPVSPLSIAPGTRQKVSQIDGVRPSTSIAPSIWYAEVATPQRKSAGRLAISACSSAGAVNTEVEGRAVGFIVRRTAPAGGRTPYWLPSGNVVGESWSGDRDAARQPAGHLAVRVVPGLGDTEYGDLRGALVEGVRAARVEGATGRHPAQVGRRA